MRVYGFNANLKKSDFFRILGEIFALCFLLLIARKKRFILRSGFQYSVYVTKVNLDKRKFLCQNLKQDFQS